MPTWTIPWGEIGLAPGGALRLQINGKYASFSGFGQQYNKRIDDEGYSSAHV